ESGDFQMYYNKLMDLVMVLVKKKPDKNGKKIVSEIGYYFFKVDEDDNGILKQNRIPILQKYFLVYFSQKGEHAGHTLYLQYETILVLRYLRNSVRIQNPRISQKQCKNSKPLGDPGKALEYHRNSDNAELFPMTCKRMMELLKSSPPQQFLDVILIDALVSEILVKCMNKNQGKKLTSDDRTVLIDLMMSVIDKDILNPFTRQPGSVFYFTMVILTYKLRDL
ncbi:hypothetical protein LOTGIDRAFT_176757, partial [Lottia gigantea]